MSLQLDTDVDVLFLQETHSSAGSEKHFLRDFHMKEGYFSHGTTAARGVATLINIKDDFKVVEINNKQQLNDDQG